MNNTNKKTLSTVEQLTSILQAEEVNLKSRSKQIRWNIKSGDVDFTFTSKSSDFTHNYHAIKYGLDGFTYKLTTGYLYK